jgi:2-iminoacetate synthase ThiH
MMEKAHNVELKLMQHALQPSETYKHRVEHMLDSENFRTGQGFQAFIPLAFHPMNTELGARAGQGQAPAPAPGLDDLKTIAIQDSFLTTSAHKSLLDNAW